MGQYLTREQTNYIYRKTETGEIINTDTLSQELEYKKQLNRIDDNNGEINPYRELMVNNVKRQTEFRQIEQLSILSNKINYVQYDKFPKNFYSLSVNPINKRKIGLEKIEHVQLDFGSTSNNLKENYLDICEGIQTEIVNTTRFNENSDLGTTYLGRSDKCRMEKLRAEESFPISEQGYMIGKLLDGTECHILLDTGASKSFMSKSYYIQCRSLHSLPKFSAKTQRIQVRNGQLVYCW